MSVNSKLRKIGSLLHDEHYRLNFLDTHGFSRWVNGEQLLSHKYCAAFGRKPNFSNPKTYTEKLQWLKLYDHRPEYTTMVDKLAVKEYVAQKIGPEYVIPLLGVWEHVEDIDFDSLPESFVLKVTHDSGGLVICRDRAKLDVVAVREKLRPLLERNYYYGTREWPYKDVPPRIIAEAYMEDSRQGELRDYKFFTFGGEPKILYIAQGRGSGKSTVADFFDMEFNHLPFTIDHDMAPVPPEKPSCFDEMKRLAAVLSQGTPQLRVDFYEVDGKVYFGEMTFFHCSGLAPFHPEHWDKIFGDWVQLPIKSI